MVGKSREAARSITWREALHAHALALRQDILAGKGEGATGGLEDPVASEALSKGLGDIAQEAVQIVEAYTLGATSAEAAKGANLAQSSPPPEFVTRLNIVLNGLEPLQKTSDQADPKPSIIQSELWQLLYKVRESAELAYARELALVELDRRILFLLHNVGPLVPADVSNAVGVDKAQVSRSVKRLLEIKLIEREQLRAPLRLTRKGQAVSERLLRLADLRNRELTFDIADQELEDFFAVIETLLDQAVLLYERERKHAQSSERPEFPRPGAPVESESRSGDKIVLDRTRIISPLMTLSSYFSRSGSLTFKRLTKLSNFEAWVLNEIGMGAPIEWNDLVDRLDRDHSQAGRTINSLLQRGLISREGKPGRRHGRFSPTEKGQQLYQVILDASRQRSAFLLSPLSKVERDAFLSTFDKIKRNASVQLERERTYEEFDHG